MNAMQAGRRAGDDAQIAGRARRTRSGAPPTGVSRPRTGGRPSHRKPLGHRPSSGQPQGHQSLSGQPPGHRPSSSHPPPPRRSPGHQAPARRRPRRPTPGDAHWDATARIWPPGGSSRPGCGSWTATGAAATERSTSSRRTATPSWSVRSRPAAPAGTNTPWRPSAPRRPPGCGYWPSAGWSGTAARHPAAYGSM